MTLYPGSDLSKMMRSFDIKMSSTSSTVKSKSKKASSRRKLTKEDIAKMKTAVAQRKTEIGQVLRIIKQATEVDLCFLVDCTGSMHHEIEGVKDSIAEIAETVYKTHDIGHRMRLAFVGYTDFDVSAESRYDVLSFTKELDDFKNFVKQVKARGGGDGPEDVQGGFTQLLKLKWREPVTKVLVHIADAPCHGAAYHGRGFADSELSLAGMKKEPLHYKSSLDSLAVIGVHYYFGRIKTHTDIMIEKFSAMLARVPGTEPIKTFEINRSGGNPEIVRDLTTAVSSAVSESIHSSTTLATRSVGKRSAMRSYEIDKEIPDFTSSACFPAKLTITRYRMPTGLKVFCGDNAMSFGLDKLDVTEEILIAKRPFAQGSLRLAYHAFNVKHNKHYVVKMSKTLGRGHNSFKRYLLDMETQTISAKLAQLFTQACKDKRMKGFIDITFGMAKVWATKPPSGAPVFGAIEKYIPDSEGKFEKFNSNHGWVSKHAKSEVFQAFTHFSFAATQGSHMVVDLQGWLLSESKALLTDPAIHSRNLLKFGRTNFGVPGFQAFFKSHTCGRSCNALGITDNKYRSRSS